MKVLAPENEKKNKLFLLCFARLIVPLNKVLALENEKKNKFSFCVLLA